MDTCRKFASMQLQPRESILLEHGAGTEIVCRQGRLWLTQYGDARDIVLKPGESFVVSLPSCLIMSDGGRADFLLRPAAGGHTDGPLQNWLRRLTSLFDPRWSGGVGRRALDGRMETHDVS